MSETTFSNDEEISTTKLEKKKVIGTIRLTGILYIAVVGGAYGAEPMVQSIGPYLSIIVMIVCSLLVMLPVCLITAELSICLPSDAGMVDWVTNAVNPFQNFFTMFVTIVSLIGAIIDNAIYPALFVSYFTEKIENLPLYGEILIKFGVTAICCICNILGIDVLGKISVLFTCFVLSPFVFFVCFGIFDSGTNWTTVLDSKPFTDMDWSLLISVLFWNINGVDGCGNICEEVKDVKRSIPRAMLALVVMTICTYVLPCFVGVLLDPNWNDWEDGSFVTISENLSIGWLNTFLPWLMFLGGTVSSMGYLLNLLCTASRLFHAFIMLDFHPIITKFIGHQSKRLQTPDVSIIIQGVIIFVLSCCMDFEQLVGVDSAFYAIRVCFICLAFVILRFRYPNLKRPYKFGDTKWKALIYAIPSILFCILCLVLGLLTDALTIILGGVLLNVVMILSLLFYWFYPKQFELHEFIKNYDPNKKEDDSTTEDEIEKIKKENESKGTIAVAEGDKAISMSTESVSEQQSRKEDSEEHEEIHINEEEQEIDEEKKSDSESDENKPIKQNKSSTSESESSD